MAAVSNDTARARHGAKEGAAPRWLAVLTLLCSFANQAWADGAAEPARAVAVEGSYIAEVQDVQSGGIRSGSVVRGLGEVDIQSDLALAFHAPPGTVFRISALAPTGGDLSATCLGDLLGASNIAAYDAPLLYELWIGGKFAHDHLYLQAGRILADAQFALTTSSCVFLNSSFGWPAFISANTHNCSPAFDRSALGVFAHYDISGNLSVQAGVYDGDPFDSRTADPAAHPNGLNFELSRSQGAFMMGEVCLTRPTEADGAARPGSIKAGLWVHTADFPDEANPSRSHSGNGGVYICAEQMLYRAPGPADADPKGLTGFVRSGISPGDRNLFTQVTDAGVSYQGLLPGRDKDTLGIGFTLASISPDASASACMVEPRIHLDHEIVGEATYSAAIGEHWHLTPDVQWIRHPGGSGARVDALVLGLRTEVDF